MKSTFIGWSVWKAHFLLSKILCRFMMDGHFEHIFKDYTMIKKWYRSINIEFRETPIENKSTKAQRQRETRYWCKTPKGAGPLNSILLAVLPAALLCFHIIACLLKKKSGPWLTLSRTVSISTTTMKYPKVSIALIYLQIFPEALSACPFGNSNDLQVLTDFPDDDNHQNSQPQRIRRRRLASLSEDPTTRQGLKDIISRRAKNNENRYGTEDRSLQEECLSEETYDAIDEDISEMSAAISEISSSIAS